MARLYQLLQEAVEGSGMSKGDFAKAVGLSRTSLFHLLRGTSLPKRATLDRIIEVVDCGDVSAGEMVHVFETERLRTIHTRRKAVRSAQELFRASVFSGLREVCECRLGEARMPDLWVVTSRGDLPVFTEMQVLDPYGLLGRAQCVRAEAGRLEDASWDGWACVSAQEGAYVKYQSMFEPFNLRIATADELVRAVEDAGAPSAGADVPRRGAEVPSAGGQEHFLVDIACD